MQTTTVTSLQTSQKEKQAYLHVCIYLAKFYLTLTLGYSQNLKKQTNKYATAGMKIETKFIQFMLDSVW